MIVADGEEKETQLNFEGGHEIGKLHKSRLQNNLHFPGAELAHTHLLQPTIQTGPSPAYRRESGEACYLSVTTFCCIVISAIPRCGPGVFNCHSKSTRPRLCLWHLARTPEMNEGLGKAHVEKRNTGRCSFGYGPLGTGNLSCISRESIRLLWRQVMRSSKIVLLYLATSKPSAYPPDPNPIMGES